MCVGDELLTFVIEAAYNLLRNISVHSIYSCCDYPYTVVVLNTNIFVNCSTSILVCFPTMFSFSRTIFYLAPRYH